MRLKRLTLHGFKTFADKTEIVFDEGVTAVVGPNGSGKCVVGSTPVTLADGRRLPIQQIVEQSLAASDHVETLDDGCLTRKNPLGLSVVSLNPDTLRLESRPIAAFVQRTAPATLLKIMTRAGRTVTATPYHPLFTLQDGRLHPLRADALQPGTAIALPRCLPDTHAHISQPLRMPEVISSFADTDSIYVAPTPQLQEWLRRVKPTFGTYNEWADTASVKPLQLKSFCDGQAVQAKALSRLMSTTATFPPLAHGLKSKGSGSVAVPKHFTQELARFLGLLVAEGRNTASAQVWFVNSDKSLCDWFEQAARNLFDVPTCRRQYKAHAEDCLLFSRALCFLLWRVFAMPIGSGSADKQVPPQVWTAPASVKWAFLSGLFEGDGYLSVRTDARTQKISPYAEYATASETLARQVVDLLLSLGVFATLRPKQKCATNTSLKRARTYYSVYVYGAENVQALAHGLQFIGKKEMARQSLLAVASVSANPNHDLVPAIQPLLKTAVKAARMRLKPERARWPKLMAYTEGRCGVDRLGLSECIEHIRTVAQNNGTNDADALLSRLQTLATSDVYWDVIESVEEVAPPDPYVYDLCVRETHNFIAGGIVVHNSNVVDSLLWCLGEQKASSLRASRAQDVIFAGSSRRKPLGMAEVSLTVDNEDRFLPLDFAEVTVTRRIYRSGEGEYFINKTPCRLKDITDLFLDTGVGRGAYAIVNQSEIDSILSARPEDRRELFEEAAGIKKYRVRKREAQRKLEATEQNLLRVRDIASEIEKSLGPLEAQSLTARRFNELTERLRQVEVGQLAADYKRLSDEANELARAAQTASEEAERLRTEAATLEATARGISEQIVDVEAQMDRARALQQSALSDSERAAGRMALASERVASANRTLAALEKDARDLEAERLRYEDEARAREAEAKEVEARAALVAEQLADAERAAKDADTRLADLSRRLSGQQADYLTLARRLAGRRAERDAVVARIARREKDLTDLGGRADTRRQEAERARLEAEQMAGQVDAARIALADAQRALTDTALPARAQAQERSARLLDERTAKEKRLAEQGARLRALEETEAAQEGYFAGVRSVTRAVERGHLTGRYDLVADLLRVPSHLDTAIEIALGGSLQDIVCDTQAEAKRAIAYLNETRGGRATFLPLDNLRDQDVPGTLRQATRQFSGVLGSAADLVDYDADVAPAIRVLLARVLITDDLDTATRVQRQVRDWARIVTLSGEVVVPTGAITGGAQGRPGPNLLGRKREIAELTDAVRAGQEQAGRMRQEEADAKAELEAARTAVRTAEAQVQSARDALRDGERRQGQRVTDANRLQADAEGQQARVSALQAEADADLVREAELAAELAAASEQDVGAQATRDQLQEAQGALALERGEAQGLVRTRSAELASLRERARALLRDAERARQGTLRATVSMEEREARAEEARAVIAQDQADAPKREAESARAKAALADAGAQLEKWRAARQALLSENFQIAERIKALERGATQATETGQTARLRSARVETQRDQVGERLLSEYEMHPDIAVERTGGAPVDRDTSQEISRLRREIKALGSVNGGAIEEWERVSSRWRFLTEQQTDLTDARTRLLAAIADIDDSTRGVFEETFRAVGEAFGRLFTRLFGGGTTELVLTNPADILETGIEIWAQPPGKKRQALSLLSGGERALTATALLFAFLEVRPSPFCVLDEVDAPLDGANVEKFTDLLRECGQKSQFIVVTHNATTMEAAPLWFGITMQEPGISRGLSLRVPAMSAPDADKPG